MEIMEFLGNEVPFIGITYFQILAAIGTIIIGFILALVISKYVKRVMMKSKMEKILAIFTARVIYILLLIFTFALAISMLGVNVGEAVIGFSVVSGFVIGFAFQETLGNLAAGFMIAITKPFKAGDYVEISGDSGRVNHVGASITTITTLDNKKIIVPNSKIWGNPITNYTANKQRMIDMRVGISYSDDMGKAVNVAMDVLKKHKNVLKDPAPNVAVAELGDSSVNLLIRPWVETKDYWTTKWDITRGIKEAFDKEKISIPFPQRDVHLFEVK